jgi:hypothetical protein
MKDYCMECLQVNNAIARLVDNDKIEYSELVEYEFDKLERFIQRRYNALLMLLSIQDEPVKFLSDILK